jgi:tetratricopeptide (TPR) repeat protein
VAVRAQHGSHLKAATEEVDATRQKPVTLLRGFGEHRHPVSTKNAEAQRFFDQGLRLVYSFNYEEAVRSFRRAAEIDPQMAMAYWGIALAHGQSITNPIVPHDQQQVPYEAAQKALSLSTHAPEKERAYIEALAKRHTLDPKASLKKLAVAYREAMREVVKRYPDDLDAATMYAESVIVLRPFQLFWTPDGKPAENTEEIINVLESVLKRNPEHIGAIHYYIHAVEASPNPERALAYAARLKSLMPGAGHLVHMPSHLHMRMGDYAAASRSNKDALAADESYFKLRGTAGSYSAMFHTHTLQYLAIASAMEGRFVDAITTARRLERHVSPHLEKMSHLDSVNSMTPLILVRFRRWDDVLKLPEPEATKKFSTLYRHFARGMAYAATRNLEEAEKERQIFSAAVKATPPKAGLGTNRLVNILQVAEGMLVAKIAVAQGDYKSAIAVLKTAAEVEDALLYDEPPPWFMPVRESLGGALLLSGDNAAAEQVFRADLEKRPRNGRALFGLLESLKRQKKKAEARPVERDFKAAWKNADTQLRVEDL